MSRAAGHLRRGTTGEAKIIHRTHYQTEVWRRKQNQTYLLFILPAFAFFFTFFLLPFAQSLVLAFTDACGYNKHFHFIGLANFKEALSNRAFLRAIWVTVRYTLFVTLGANVSALVLALLLDSNTHFKKLFRAVFFLPNLMSLIIVGFVWVFLYGNVYRSAVQAFGIPEAYQISWLGSMKLAVYSIGLTAIWQCAGYYMIIYIAGLQNISKDLLEAAAVDGANKWTVITRIKLPLLAPVVVMNVILCLASCFKAFDIPMAMTSGGPADNDRAPDLQHRLQLQPDRIRNRAIHHPVSDHLRHYSGSLSVPRQKGRVKCVKQEQARADMQSQFLSV